MKQYNVILSPKAETHLKNITAYIEQEYQSPRTAEAIFEGILAKIFTLNEFPRKNPLVSHEPERSHGFRIQPVGKYSVVYTIEEEVVTALHIAPSSSHYIAKLRGTP